MAQKYINLSEGNQLFLEKIKKEKGIKTDNKAINFILEEYEKYTTQQEQKEEFENGVVNKLVEQFGDVFRTIYAATREVEINTTILKDVANVFLIRDGIEHGALYDVLPAEYIKMSEDNIKKKIGKAKQKKDHKK